jgi:MFS family permease
VYVVGFGGAVLSSFFLLRIRVPESKVVARERKKRTGKPSIETIRSMFAENRDFVLITANTFVFDLGAWLVGPLYILFFVRDLGASDGWIGLNSTLANLGVIAGYAIWRRILHRMGYGRTLLLSLPLATSYAFLVSLFPSLNAILVWGVLINLVNPGVNLSHFNILLKLAPEERRASYMALYSSVMNAGAFVAPMIGIALAEWWDIRTVLLIGGSIRVVGVCLFYILRLRGTDTASA